jgi:hypothetical protein
MKIVLGIVATAALALVMGGCGSSSEGGDGFGSEPDLAGAKARFDHPDGTFSGANASQVLDRGSEGSSSADGLNFGAPTGSGSGSSTTKSLGLHVLDATSGRSSPFNCNAFSSGQQTGSCTCPSGGSIDYVIRSDGEGAARGAVMKIRMNACASGDSMVDGNEYLDIRTDTTVQTKPVFSMLLIIDAQVTNAGVSKHIDLQSRYSNGSAEIAVKVDDGWVVVRVESPNNGESGSWTVRDKNGSWTCTVDNGHGTCSSDKGETKTF